MLLRLSAVLLLLLPSAAAPAPFPMSESGTVFGPFLPGAAEISVSLNGEHVGNFLDLSFFIPDSGIVHATVRLSYGTGVYPNVADHQVPNLDLALIGPEGTLCSNTEDGDGGISFLSFGNRPGVNYPCSVPAAQLFDTRLTARAYGVVGLAEATLVVDVG